MVATFVTMYRRSILQKAKKRRERDIKELIDKEWEKNNQDLLSEINYKFINVKAFGLVTKNITMAQQISSRVPVPRWIFYTHGECVSSIRWGNCCKNTRNPCLGKILVDTPQ